MRGIIFVSLFCLGLQLHANGRVARAQSNYNAHIQNEAQGLKLRLGNKIHSFVGDHVAELEGILPILHVEQADIRQMSFASIIDKQSIGSNLRLALEQAARAVNEHESVLDQASKKLEVNASQLDAYRIPGFCEKELAAIEFEPRPVAYAPYEAVDISHIPAPETKGVSPVPGHSSDDSDISVESGVMMAATTAGAAIGSAVPVLGTIVGAGVGFLFGALAGYGAGKAAVAVKVSIENSEARDAYNQAVRAEIARQNGEIEETRAWIVQHPVQQSDIFRAAARFCADDVWRLEYAKQISLWQQRHDEAHDLLSSTRLVLDSIRLSIVNAQSQMNF